MQAPEHHNWIAGRWTESSGGIAFATLSHLPPYDELGRWPRSNERDVEEALEACARAAPAWQDLGRSERGRILERVPGELERQELLPSLAAALGLMSEELEARFQRDLFELREALELVRDGARERGVGLFQANWSDLAGALGGRLAARLASGQTAVLVSDPHLPQAAQAVALALEASGLPPGVVCLLHDDGETAVRSALACPGLAWARLRGAEPKLKRLHDVAPLPNALAWSLWPVVNRTHLVPAGADPAAQAALVVEQAFGRSATLSGQFPGHIGRVLCHQRLFSRFSEELLTRLEDSPDASAPVPAIEAELFEHVRSAWALGLDEGATPIHGGEPWRAPRVGVPRESEGPAPAARAPRAIPPAVFTNVEIHQRFARLHRPAPILALLRSPSDEAARELVLELDGPRPLATWGSDARLPIQDARGQPDPSRPEREVPRSPGATP